MVEGERHYVPVGARSSTVTGKSENKRNRGRALAPFLLLTCLLKQILLKLQLVRQTTPTTPARPSKEIIILKKVVNQGCEINFVSTIINLILLFQGNATQLQIGSRRNAK
jgi:hypothetical protein